MYKFDLGNNIHAEIQVSISAFENIYDESHRNYEQIRRYQANGETSGAEEAEIQALIARNNELHSGAWNAVKDDYAAVYGREIDPR
jgi:hypothetical protein